MSDIEKPKIGRPRSTHCKNGHEFTPETTSYAGGSRFCRICRNAYRVQLRKKWRETNPPKQRTYTKKARTPFVVVRREAYDITEHETAFFRTKFVASDAASCWEWHGRLNSYGYGIFQVIRCRKKFGLQAHRIAYEMVNGPIPDGLVIDHLCRNRSCVNPSHMEAVTTRENLERGDSWAHPMPQPQSIKTHCPRGHAYDEQNTGYYINPKGYRHRRCRACLRMLAREYRRKRSAEGVHAALHGNCGQ